MHSFGNRFCAMDLTSFRSNGDIVENLRSYIVPIVVVVMSSSGIGYTTNSCIEHDGRLPRLYWYLKGDA